VTGFLQETGNKILKKYKTPHSTSTSKALSSERSFLENERCWLENEEISNYINITSEYIQCLDELTKIVTYVKNYLQSRLISAANHLQGVCERSYSENTLWSVTFVT